MAELIPMEFRIQAMQKRLIARWSVGVVLTLALCGGGIAYCYGWLQQQARSFEAVQKEFVSNSVLIEQAKVAEARRRDLAARMQKMDELEADKLLLSLLRTVSESFSENDSLVYISIDAHGTTSGNAGKGKAPYGVQITGITVDETTYADLFGRMTNAGKKANPPILVQHVSNKLETYMDGEVMRFRIQCLPKEAEGG